MARTLAFKARLARGPDFVLDAEAVIPLEGVTAIAGQSGSGKTTLLRALAGLDQQKGDAVRVDFAGQAWDDAERHTPPEERRVGFVFQDPSLFPHLSVEQNLRYGARRRQIASLDAIVDALDLKSLLPRATEGLSGGEARRVALARALASDPAVLFLDEPLSGMDWDRKGEVLPYLARAVSEAQVPALYVTHAADEIAMLADRVLTMDAGQVVGWAPPPIRMSARVEGIGPNGMLIALDGATEGKGRFSVPIRARVGEAIGLGVPADSLMVSATHPGNSSAAMVVPADILDGANDGSGIRVSVFGQEVHLPMLDIGLTGSRVWLSILRALPRPEPRDSQADANHD
ncbi:MAG: ATP-binding cassette domain-containing protein [Paracoccaceae bacterium]|nr:ATP-binding cassette domain-containing protein [Paracoccaceae bacterium]